MIYLLASPCRPAKMGKWMLSWKGSPKASPIRSSHSPFIMWMAIAFAQEATSVVGPIGKPRILEFVLLAPMARDYYGIVEEISKLNFECCKAHNPIVFKCHWFDPNDTRTTLRLDKSKFDRILSIMVRVSILWLNRPRKFIISHGCAKKTPILWVGTLSSCTINCLSQTMRITTLTQIHRSSIN